MRRTNTVISGLSTLNFNPRTHEGCDVIRHNPKVSESLFQSTHPRRVRREQRARIKSLELISIHAPTKGATCQLIVDDEIKANFNPRTHEGCDELKVKENGTHSNFNPRTHEGCDSAFSALLAVSHLFQSTHPRRVRQQAVAKYIDDQHFNPRTHEGCDRP